MDDHEFRERQAERRAKRAEAARGITNKRTLELGEELLRPIGARMSGEGPRALTPRSRASFHEVLREVVVNGQDDELMARQAGWAHGERKGDDVA
jgi:hypothetical protein